MKTKPILMLTLLVLGISLGREAQAFYNPTTGRWLSRDPIQEKGGRNLFGFVHNDGVNLIDLLGLRRGDGIYTDCSCAKWKVVDVIGVTLYGSRRSFLTDVGHANNVFEQCCIKVNSVRRITTDEYTSQYVLGTDLNLNLNQWDNSPSYEEINLSLLRGESHTVHAYYVRSIMGLFPRAGTSYPFSRSGFKALALAFAVANPDGGDDPRDDKLVFAHELGHVLLDSGDHDVPSSNLMADYRFRTPGADKLTPSQCDRMRKFRLLRDSQ